jgi:hypothetical protein
MKLPERLTARRVEKGASIGGTTLRPIPEMCATEEKALRDCTTLLAWTTSSAATRFDLPFPDDDGSPGSMLLLYAHEASSMS